MGCAAQEPPNLVSEVDEGQPVAHFWRQEYDFWSSPGCNEFCHRRVPGRGETVSPPAIDINSESLRVACIRQNKGAAVI